MITGGTRRATRSARSTSRARSTRSGPRPRPARERFVYASSVAAYGFHRDNPVADDRGLADAARARTCSTPRRRPRSSGCSRRRPPPPRARPVPAAPADRPRAARGRRQGRPARAARTARRRLGGLVAAAARPGPRAAGPDPVHPRGGRRPGVPALHRRCGGPRGVQHHRRRRADRRAGGARARSDAPPAPDGLVRAAARGVAAVPFAPPLAEWAEAVSHPAIMDATKAKQELGWRPRYTSLEALRDTLNSREG